MNEKLLIIIATQDKDKALTALAYTHNTIKYNWLSDVKVIFFGPFENLIATDADIAKEVAAIALLTGTTACKFLSDRDGISEEIAKLGIAVDYVGTMISDYIKDGYVPMVW
ncbi:MAG: hypothetical protein RTU09_03625 [Candidatus Thorarchaeota archaeon]